MEIMETQSHFLQNINKTHSYIRQNSEETYLLQNAEETHLLQNTEETHLLQNTEETHLQQNAEETHLLQNAEETHFLQNAEDTHLLQNAEETHLLQITEETDSYIWQNNEEAQVLPDTDETHSYLLRNTELPLECRSEEHVWPIRNASVQDNTRMLLVDWDDEDVIMSSDLFPFVWLRDNCTCSDCYDERTGCRLLAFEDLKLSVRPVHVKVQNDGDSIHIKWSDSHTSDYTAKWLQQRVFSKARKKQRLSPYKLGRMLWDSSFKDNAPRANFQELLADDAALLRWLQQVEVYGIVLVEEVPLERGHVQQLAKRAAGFTQNSKPGGDCLEKGTYYVYDSVTTDANGFLELHSQAPYLEHTSWIRMLHCLADHEGNGAETRIVDGVKVAKQIRDEYPEQYNVLTTTQVSWRAKGATDEGKAYDLSVQKPVISLDSKGEVCNVNYDHRHLDSVSDCDLETVSRWYSAMKIFCDLLYHPENMIEFKPTPGTIQVYDSQRVLYGRASCKGGNGNRIAESCFVDWDEARSTRRVLEDRLGCTSEHLVF